jgi:hypothetical protein
MPTERITSAQGNASKHTSLIMTISKVLNFTKVKGENMKSLKDTETLEELVAQRRGYKYLSKNGVSPYQHHVYDLTSRKVMSTQVNGNLSHDCGHGWNLATLKWIADNCLKLEGIIIECSIPKTATIIVPKNSDGKFRTDKIRIREVYTIESLFPIVKNLKGRLSNYKPTNPITAEKIPPIRKIKKILSQVRNQVWDQVRNQVWNQVGNQVRNQVRNQVWDQVRNQVWNQVGNQVGDQVGNQVRDQVWDQVGVIAYYAVKVFMNLPYEHPAFDLVRLGVMVVNVLGKYKVFGKGGKYLGEIDAK